MHRALAALRRDCMWLTRKQGNEQRIRSEMERATHMPGSASLTKLDRALAPTETAAFAGADMSYSATADRKQAYPPTHRVGRGPKPEERGLDENRS